MGKAPTGVADMMGCMDKPGLNLNISAVERETGLSKDVLRVWERRYAFPRPSRDENGERLYTAAEITKLRAIKRLMDVGMRPGKIILCSQQELDALAEARIAPRGAEFAPAFERGIVAMLKTHDAPALQQALANLLMKQGLQRFVLDTLTPLNRAIGDAWMRGELEVFEEHLYTEQLQVALRTAINAFPRQTGTPRALDDVSGRASRRWPPDGRGAAGARGSSVHFARCADAARRYPARGACAQGASHRAVVFRRLPGAAGERRPGGAAPATAGDGHALGRR